MDTAADTRRRLECACIDRSEEHCPAVATKHELGLYYKATSHGCLVHYEMDTIVSSMKEMSGRYSRQETVETNIMNLIDHIRTMTSLRHESK